MSKLTMKRNLESNLKDSYISSGNMSVEYCSIDISSAGLIDVNITLNNSGMPKEWVEQMVEKTFNSIGVKTFVKNDWGDIIVKHDGITSTVKAQGFMSKPKV